MIFFWIYVSMRNVSPTARKYLNCKPPKWEHALQRMPFISSENKTNFLEKIFKFLVREFFTLWFHFSNYDLKQLPLTYGRSDEQRRFTFDFIPNELYEPNVSTKFVCSKFQMATNLKEEKNPPRTDFHPQSWGFSEFQFEIILLATSLSWNIWVFDTGENWN